MKITQALAQCPVSSLVKKDEDGNKVANYPGAFVFTVETVLKARGVKYDAATVEKIAEHINLATFQRTAAAEAAKHLGAFDRKKGKRLEPEGRAARPLRKTGGKRVDPVTGEPVAKKGKAAKEKPAKAEKAATKNAKAAKLAALAKAREAVAKVKAGKAGKGTKGGTAEKLKNGAKRDKPEAPAKNGGKAKKEIDPITGEPVEA